MAARDHARPQRPEGHGSAACQPRRGVTRQRHLAGAYLDGADLCRADLRGADLRGADMRALHLREAVLTGARADAGTVWPADFDADERQRHGIVETRPFVLPNGRRAEPVST